jgi:hypothetical protein
MSPVVAVKRPPTVRARLANPSVTVRHRTNPLRDTGVALGQDRARRAAPPGPAPSLARRRCIYCSNYASNLSSIASTRGPPDVEFSFRMKWAFDEATSFQSSRVYHFASDGWMW